jgi:hypothetical protein
MEYLERHGPLQAFLDCVKDPAECAAAKNTEKTVYMARNLGQVFCAAFCDGMAPPGVCRRDPCCSAERSHIPPQGEFVIILTNLMSQVLPGR